MAIVDKKNVAHFCQKTSEILRINSEISRENTISEPQNSKTSKKK